MKLNLGCGFDKREGWLNVDNFAPCEPDQLLDIEATPWDLPTDRFEHVLLRHVLEHVGADFETFGAVIRELYRVTAPGGRVEVHLPHVRHDSFWIDPTHVRGYMPQTFRMLSKRSNREWAENRANMTLLAEMLDVDFEVERVVHVFDDAWAERIRSGEVAQAEAQALARERWNVIREFHVHMRVVK